MYFVVKIRIQNGEEFEPDTLTSISRSFDRFLREQGKHSSRAADSVRKVLQPLSTVSSHSEPTRIFSGATFKNCSFTFASERNLEESSKKRFKRVLSFDISDKDL